MRKNGARYQIRVTNGGEKMKDSNEREEEYFVSMEGVYLQDR